MLKIENVQVLGFEPAIRGMRNPMNSWEKSDSYATHIEDSETLQTAEFEFFAGDNDQRLMMSLAKGGPVHAKYRRMITVYLDITAPLYWWKEFDTYKVGTVANSCSTMHKIHAKEFTLEDFSCEHLSYRSIHQLGDTIDTLNYYRKAFIEYKDGDVFMEDDGQIMGKKDLWHQMIQLLPSSYNQKRTIMLNYEVLHNIYHSRRHHKLDEWHVVCDWIEQLPYAEVIIGEKNAEE